MGDRRSRIFVFLVFMALVTPFFTLSSGCGQEAGLQQSWDFDQSGDYSFDSELITVNEGDDSTAALKELPADAFWNVTYEVPLPEQAPEYHQIAFDPDGNIVDTSSSLGSIVDSLVCFTPDEFRTYQIVVTATDACGATDSDTVNVTVNVGGVVAIICPEGTHTDTLCGPDTICVVAPITPDNALVSVQPNGYYNPMNGTVCVGIDEAGTYEVTVIAEALCGSDTCEFTLVVVFAEPPVVACPEYVNKTLCLTEPTSVSMS